MKAHSAAERAIRGLGHALCLVGLVFLSAPIAVVIPLSFSPDSYFAYPMRGFSFRWYEVLVHSDAWQRALRNSLVVGVATTAIATSLGSAAAVGLNRLSPRLRTLLVGIMISPMIVPGIVIALGLFLFYSPLGLAGTLTGIIIAHTVLGIPLSAAKTV